MEKVIHKLWEETLYYGENGFYSKRLIPHGTHGNTVAEQINLGYGWETICYIHVVKAHGQVLQYDLGDT